MKVLIYTGSADNFYLLLCLLVLFAGRYASRNVPLISTKNILNLVITIKVHLPRFEPVVAISYLTIIATWPWEIVQICWN